MIAALAFLLLAQTAPVADVDPVDAGDDIVVTAEVGRVTLIFDRGTDGRLHNCRVMRSSGVDRIDAEACRELPDCITDTAGKQFCGTPAVREPDIAEIKPAGAGSPSLAITDLLEPDPVIDPDVGPSAAQSDKDDDDPRLKKLPPPPKDETHDPAIKFTAGGSN